MDEGTRAVKNARAVIERTCGGAMAPVPLPTGFDRKAGVFVTINRFPSLDLRGCIGYPEPIFPLKQALTMAAQGATRDPRFPPLRADELEGIVVEVSILTPPVLLEANTPKDFVKKVKIGRDGLIAEHGAFKGLLLPQVPVEWGWDAEEFISETCMKAGLMPDSWLEKGIKLYSFQAEIFSEDRPRGKVVRKELGGKE